MASSVKIVLRKDKQNAQGESPLYLRIIKDRKPKYIALGISVPEKYWDEANKRIKKGMANSQRINNLIVNKIAEAQNQAIALQTDDNRISSQKIKESIVGVKSPSFIEYSKVYFKIMEGKIAGATIAKGEGIINKISRYLNGKDITFEEITVRWLKEYEHYLRSEIGNSNNTICVNMKVLRRIFNEAIRDEIIPYEKNPFIKYKNKWEKTTKIFLDEEEILKIENLDLEVGTRIYHTRNAWILSAYAGGLRFSDICRLKWSNYDGERIFIYTKKCKGVPVTIKLPSKAIEILNLYLADKSGQDSYVFPFLENGRDYGDEYAWMRAIDSQDTLCNKALKDIADHAKIDKHITFHTSRHTWATRALRKGMRIEYVSRLMGHADIKTTQIYAKIVNEELDKAMDLFNEPQQEYALKVS